MKTFIPSATRLLIALFCACLLLIGLSACGGGGSEAVVAPATHDGPKSVATEYATSDGAMGKYQGVWLTDCSVQKRGDTFANFRTMLEFSPAATNVAIGTLTVIFCNDQTAASPAALTVTFVASASAMSSVSAGSERWAGKVDQVSIASVPVALATPSTVIRNYTVGFLDAFSQLQFTSGDSDTIPLGLTLTKSDTKPVYTPAH